MSAADTSNEPVRRSRPIVWLVGLVSFAIPVVLVLMAIPAARDSARRLSSGNNLKQIGLGLQNYHDAQESFPPGGTFRNDGTGLHGWQTLFLPYLEANTFGNCIDVNLPWDDPTQLDAYRQFCFRTYLDPSLAEKRTADGFPVIHYSANEWLLHRNSAVRLTEIPDAGRTLLVADAFGEFLPWGSPYNWRDPTVPFRASSRQFGSVARKGTLAVFVDGSVQLVEPDIDAELFSKFAGPPSLRPSPELVERPTEPYRLKSKDYWRFVFVNERGETYHSKDEHFVKLKSSSDGRNLEADFNDRFPKSEEKLSHWRTGLKPFLESKDLESVQVSGKLDALELEPFLAIPTLKRLSLRAADIHGDKEAVLGRARKNIVID